MTSARYTMPLRVLRFASVYWRAALGATYALTLGLGSRRHRGLLAIIARHFGYDGHGAKPALPRTPLHEAAPPRARPDLRELPGVDGNVTVLELVVLGALTARLDARAVFEIGTFDGRTTVNLTANAAEDAVVFTLDLPVASGEPALEVAVDDRKYMPSSRSGSRITASEFAPRIHRLFGDSATFDFTPYAGTIDICFIDGSHAYDYVRNDSARAFEMVRPGGLIVWHDYSSWPGVTEALDELHRTVPAFASLSWIEETTLAVLRRDMVATGDG